MCLTLIFRDVEMVPAQDQMVPVPQDEIVLAQDQMVPAQETVPVNDQVVTAKGKKM